MNKDDQPMKKYGNISEDEKRARTAKTAAAKEKEARRTSIKPDKKG